MKKQAKVLCISGAAIATASLPKQEEKLPDDYETCGDCGFDHEYEYQQAYAWHIANPGQGY